MEWISVYERKPDRYITVLVCHKNGNVGRSLWNNFHNHWHYYGIKHHGITHWMELPKNNNWATHKIKKMEKLGSELEFISRIKRDGSGTEPLDEKFKELLQKDTFKVRCLSMSKGTFIASNMSCFVVKLKPLQEEENQETWETIMIEFIKTNTDFMHYDNWLKENYNVPTRKTQIK